MRRILSLFAAVLALALAACTPPKAVLKSSQQVLSELEPHYRIGKPAGSGPFPTVILLHGASDNAWYDHFDKVTAQLNDAGFATVFVDSYAGRGISGTSVRGGTLLPPERASDLLVTLDWTINQPWVKKDGIGALGYSHGGATIMDALVLAPPTRKPNGLTDIPAAGMSPLKAAVLFYPWCADDIAGIELTKAYDEDWSAKTSLLAFLPGNDQMSDMDLCQSILTRHAAKGLPIRQVPLKGVGHTFDQVTDDHGNPQDTYDAAAAKKAYEDTLRFFTENLK